MQTMSVLMNLQKMIHWLSSSCQQVSASEQEYKKEKQLQK